MRMRRAIGVVALLVLPMTAATFGFASMASAATASVTCSKLKVNLTSDLATLSGCTDPANTGKSGTIPIGELAGGAGSMGTITWHGTVGTTTVTETEFATVAKDKCPTGYTEYEVKANITGGTGASLKSIKKGWTFEAFVCANLTTDQFELLPGTKVDIGKGY
jgi:hypothetical protein